MRKDMNVNKIMDSPFHHRTSMANIISIFTIFPGSQLSLYKNKSIGLLCIVWLLICASDTNVAMKCGVFRRTKTSNAGLCVCPSFFSIFPSFCHMLTQFTSFGSWKIPRQNYSKKKPIWSDSSDANKSSNKMQLFYKLIIWRFVSLTMFRVPLRPSSGTYNCTRNLWFYRWRVAVGALLVVVWQVMKWFKCAAGGVRFSFNAIHMPKIA
jgi:hypothetical protein